MALDARWQRRGAQPRGPAGEHEMTNMLREVAGVPGSLISVVGVICRGVLVCHHTLLPCKPKAAGLHLSDLRGGQTPDRPTRIARRDFMHSQHACMCVCVDVCLCIVGVHVGIGAGADAGVGVRCRCTEV